MQRLVEVLGLSVNSAQRIIAKVGATRRYWDYSKPLPAKGNIELHYVQRLYWNNIYAKDLNRASERTY